MIGVDTYRVISVDAYRVIGVVLGQGGTYIHTYGHTDDELSDQPTRLLEFHML